MTRFISLLVACAVAVLGAAPSDAVTGPRRVLLMGGKKAIVASYSGPGDVVTGATAFYGLRGYNKAYATGANHAINIRRASDSTTTDINILTNGNLDVATATSFCAATTCFVDTIYDQIGTHTIIQATTTAQPQLTFNCLNTSLPCLTAVSASSQFLSGTFATIAQPNTFSFVAERTGAATMGAVIGADNAAQAGFNAVANQAFVFAGTTQAVTAADNALHAIQAVMQGTTSTINVDGTLSGSLSAGTSAIATPLQIGASGVGTNPFNGFFAEALIYGGVALSSANQTALCHNQRTYWGSGGTC
jgi:Alpha-L-arabinofuranosidase B, catalytic